MEYKYLHCYILLNKLGPKANNQVTVALCLCGLFCGKFCAVSAYMKTGACNVSMCWQLKKWAPFGSTCLMSFQEKCNYLKTISYFCQNLHISF